MIAAPAIVAIGSLMPVRGIVMDVAPWQYEWQEIGRQILIVKGYERYLAGWDQWGRCVAETVEVMAANSLSKPAVEISQIIVGVSA